MTNPFLVHKVKLKRHVPKDNEAKDDSRFKTTALFKFVDDAEITTSRGFKALLQIRFKMPDGILDDSVKLPTIANEEVSLEFFKNRPDELAYKLMLVGIERKHHIVDKYVPRGYDDEIEVDRFIYHSSERDAFGGFILSLGLHYHMPSDRAKSLLKTKHPFLAITQKTEQTTLEG